MAVDDLDGKRWLGDTRDGVYAGLGAALDTARWLRDQAGLGFVAAPEPTRDGAAARRLSPRYAVALYRYIEGRSWEFGHQLPPEARDRLIDLLAALHQVHPRVPGAGGPARTCPSGTGWSRPSVTWDGPGPAARTPSRPGPCWPARPGPSETCWPPSTGWPRGWRPRRTGSSPTASPTRATSCAPADGLRLIDWDTVGLAHPERDLWHVLGSIDSHAARRYTRATGHPVDPDGLRFYRLRWALDDLAAFTGELRAGHEDTADTREAWQALNETVTHVIRLA